MILFDRIIFKNMSSVNPSKAAEKPAIQLETRLTDLEDIIKSIQAQLNPH
jgi:hypothetical protein